VVVLQAQAQAEQELVRQVKQAEADETRSKHKAVEINNLAQAELEAAAKQAEAKKRMAEGIEAERAAPGLADARVLEVTAAAKEKDGLADARVRAEQLIAEAKGEQEKGLAEARVLEAQAAAKEKDGLAEAKVLEEKLGAQARGEQQLGAAKAQATKDLGTSEADVLLQRLNAEAEGLSKKFGALDALSDSARQHEEFRMQLEKSFEEAMAAIAANKEIAKDQAEVLATALGKAKIEIVGGEGDFFNSFAKSLSVGKAIEGVVGKSPVVQDVLARLLAGKAAPAVPAAVPTPGSEQA
jgi:hypothetical protein